jgi:molybdopterin converting factor small subunit
MNLAANRAPDEAPSRQTEAGAGASVVLLLFAEARVAAGTGREARQGRTVGDVLDAATARYGSRFAAVLDRSRVWVNGEPAQRDHQLEDGDEVAVLPPVSGGATGSDQEGG